MLAEPWKAGDGLKTAVRLEQLNRVLNMARGGAEFDAERLAAAVAGLIDGSCGRTDTAVVLGVVDLLRSAYRGGL
ncbi:hypothetical protein ACF08B_33035 [Streptomyces sp. NPDC015139]|uniref:hypothetical protein n=1 Tax=Streptomyces sp. NPDC015139 TaxID=3364942 RepID=UPI0036FE7B15